MTDNELIAPSVQMRAAQREYFRSRTPDALRRSKALEAAFDKAAANRAQGGLDLGGDNG